MSTLPLSQHGTYVNPSYVYANGGTSIGKSVDAERPDGQLSGIVKRFEKTASASESTLSFDSIKSVYPEAVEYTSSKQTLRGMVLMGGIPASIALIWLESKPILDIIHQQNVGVFDLVILILFLLLIVAAAGLLLMTVRFELFCPVDLPVIFDRKNRKVYRILRETKPGFLGLFKPWPLRACEYEWNLIDAEHTAVVSTTGSTIMRRHALVFLVRRSENDATIIDSFNIGNSMELGPATVPGVWEHIRRFMEERGPHVPPGESLASGRLPQTLWQSLCAVGPFGANYQKWWKGMFVFMLLIHVLFVFFVPFFVLWGIFNWISYKTAIPVAWPEEVEAMVGQKIR
jgi:hypothetical protein